MIRHKGIFLNCIHPFICRLVLVLVIGEVEVRGQIGLQTAVDQLKAMARDMGGDAIMNYRSYRAGPGTPGAGYLVAQGRVVRWK
jgi:uncharacterized protein YbjQ (UPF0145 family)